MWTSNVCVCVKFVLKFEGMTEMLAEVSSEGTAHVAQWLKHSVAMCSRAWRA